MKRILFLIFLVSPFAAAAQQLSYDEFEKLATQNKALLPKYGYLPKSEEEKKADEEFIKTVLDRDSTNRKGSDHLISLGFKYLYRDIKTAMYRFNQAYLLDSNNVDIYWGYGAVYLTLGNYAKAEQQYRQGLAIDPKSTHLLTDYGTYFMAQYYGLKPVAEKDAARNLDSAITYMTRSYAIDPRDQNTLFKLSVCYWNRDECENAWKYYDECVALGGQPITEDYTKDLKKKCKRKNPK